jgi:hypothetical protein
MTENLPVPVEIDEPFAEPRRRDQIYQALSKFGIRMLRITYSGSCDSGCIDEIEALTKDRELIPLPATPVAITLTHTDYDFATAQYRTASKSVETMPLNEAVEQWCYDLLEEHFPGWEINEGSSGTIIIDATERQGSIDHTYLVPHIESRRFQ